MSARTAGERRRRRRWWYCNASRRVSDNGFNLINNESGSESRALAYRLKKSSRFSTLFWKVLKTCVKCNFYYGKKILK